MMIGSRIGVMMNKTVTRTYWDFVPSKEIIPNMWYIQAILFDDVSVEYDEKNESWCRKVVNVKGEIRDKIFYPYSNPIVNYNQWVEGAQEQ